jgi:hypothetical protein
MVYGLKCDCESQLDIKVDTFGIFSNYLNYFDQKVKDGIMEEIPVETPLYVWNNENKEIKWYADKWYRCKICGLIWEFEYPDFPACGNVRIINRR